MSKLGRHVASAVEFDDAANLKPAAHAAFLAKQVAPALAPALKSVVAQAVHVASAVALEASCRSSVVKILQGVSPFFAAGGQG